MEKYDVSIIVPVYNREKLIQPCIDSINAQTYDRKKWEVIFVDDCSSDKSCEVIERGIDKGINYRIIRRVVPSGNASAPRNEGIKSSLAKYVYFLDTDDFICPELLKNGVEIATKNDSDIVYFKLERNKRKNVVRPFLIPIVDKADIAINHLMRTLVVFKMFKKSMLLQNDILFDVTVNVYEDNLFAALALLYAENVSILADRDYYFATLHQENHLSRQKQTLDKAFQMYSVTLQKLYCANRDLEFKRKFYNALLIRCVEHLRDTYRKNSAENKELNAIFSLCSAMFNLHKEMLDISQIYENEKLLVLTLIAGDIKYFFELSRAGTSKLYLDLESFMRKTFEMKGSFMKAWIYANKIIVLDFLFKDKRIAFDIEVDEKKEECKVWLFCRNDSSYLNFLQGYEVKENKILIDKNKIKNKQIIANKIEMILNKITKGQDNDSCK